MVSVVDWPDGVPSCIMPTSPIGGLMDNRYSFDADAPYPPIERPMSSWTPEVYSVELVPISIAQFVLFQEWYKSDLRYGVLPFKWWHPITKTRAAWKIVKNDPPYQVSKIGAIPRDSGLRRIKLSFSIMSFPASFAPDYLAQEGADLVLQEGSDRIIVNDGFVFDGT